MIFVTPTILGLNPQNMVVIKPIGGGMLGISDLYAMTIQTQLSVVQPVNVKAQLYIVNRELYRFEDTGSYMEYNLIIRRQGERTSLAFRIRNVGGITQPPFPLILQVCTFDVSAGERYKRCHSGQFPVAFNNRNVLLTAFE